MIRRDLIAPLGALIRRQCDARGEHLAFEDSGGDRASYRDLERRTAALAVALARGGCEPGDRAAVLLPNSVDWVVATLAIARAAGVSVPVSHDSTESEIEYRLEDAACTVLIASARHAATIARLRAKLPALRTVIYRDAVEGDDGPRLGALCAGEPGGAPRDPDDLHRLAFIVYTSGTTGRAKGVMLTEHGMLWVNAACYAPIASLGPDDTMLSPLPLFHSYALNLCVLSVVACGASAFVLERFSTQEVLRQLATGRFTLMPGVPTMFHYLLDACTSAGTRTLAGLRRCISAGAVLPATLNRGFEAQFGIPLLDGYGITETSTMVTMNWPGDARVMGSCGLPVPGLSVRLVDANGDDVPAGAEGELIVRGPSVMLGYLNKPAETEAVLRNGWYRTGDLARADENAFLTITGRVKELIIRGGQNIAPAEVEEAVLKHPAVLDCAVLGAPHSHLGEVPVVCVVVRPGMRVEAAALREHCAGLLSAYKVPESVFEVESIPRTGSGKIVRYQLKAVVGGAAAGR
ncbi:MAG: AMP-binding protein [Burkholderiaceae bacterium]|jgi:long-chain acyl-CoA synthetase|nr:AMP-binding protein [Burkholderiales bacterium]MCZ8097334.1 AMP-binding protein [Burkholderiales bacterium]MCZ8340678.1 AMP-binding protein [Burkholderiaceae bacterium]